MVKPIRQETEPVNADSFLDIVASVVCIMLIMVLMIGMRIRNTPIDPGLIGEAAQSGGGSEKALAEEQSLRGEVTKVMLDIQDLEQQAAVQALERDGLATAVAAMEHQIGARRSQMDAQTQADLDAARSLSDAGRRLDELRERRSHVETARPEPIVVESYPTPIGRAVNDEEFHFHLRQRRVAHVPLEKLMRMALDDARRKADKLLARDGLPEFTEIVGPEDGFRLRYTAERYEEVEQRLDGAAVRRAGLRSNQWTIIPVAGQLGETVEEALAPGSALRRVLAERKSDKTAVTLWVYPDSFDAFRRLRKELHQLGFGVAARPLPEGMMIAGSPKGSKSEAE